MHYPLPAHSFSQEDLTSPQSLMNSICLHSRGFNRHFPRALLHGPLRYGGLGESSLYAEHGASKLLHFLHHMRRKDKGGLQLAASIAYTQLEVGTDTSFFNLDYQTWGPLATPTWSTHLWRFLCEIGGNSVHHRGLPGSHPFNASMMCS